MGELNINSQTLTGSIVGSSARWMAPGSPPESTASRASSKTGAGGHITISSAAAAPASQPSRRNFRGPPRLQDETFEAVGLAGARNRRQAWSREASAAGTRGAARGPASTERRSAATACGDLADDVWGEDEEEEEAQQETEKETAREMVKASFGDRGAGRNRRRSILCPAVPSSDACCLLTLKMTDRKQGDGALRLLVATASSPNS
jgi:hypothetical protein